MRMYTPRRMNLFSPAPENPFRTPTGLRRFSNIHHSAWTVQIHVVCVLYPHSTLRLGLLWQSPINKKYHQGRWFSGGFNENCIIMGIQFFHFQLLGEASVFCLLLLGRIKDTWAHFNASNHLIFGESEWWYDIGDVRRRKMTTFPHWINNDISKYYNECRVDSNRFRQRWQEMIKKTQTNAVMITAMERNQFNNKSLIWVWSTWTS